MSHSDKDAPEWMKRNDPALRGPAIHRCDTAWFIALNGAGQCDIDKPFTASTVRRICWYRLLDEAGAAAPTFRGSRKGERHILFWRPNRRRVRNSTATLRKQHFAGVELDDSELEVDDHRHSPFRGYWD